MTLLLDCGNTALKCQYNKKLTVLYLDDQQFEDNLINYIQTLPPNAKAVLSSVASPDIHDIITNALNKYFTNPIQIATTESQFKTLKIAYKKTDQLGVDRWLAMVATQHLNMHHIIIDAGSWIKLDIVLNDGQHQGGVIISKSKQDEGHLFNRFNLSPDSCDNKNLMFGSSTLECLCLSLNRYGLNAVNHILNQWLKQLKTPCQIIISGGDSHEVIKSIQQLDKLALNNILDIQQKENLVLSGLYTRYCSI